MFNEKEFYWHGYKIQIKLAEAMPGIIITMIGETLVGESKDESELREFYLRGHLGKPPRNLWTVLNKMKHSLDNYRENIRAKNEN